MIYPRHTLLDISLEGRIRLLHHCLDCNMDSALLRAMLLPEEYAPMNAACLGDGGLRRPVPGIARREVGADAKNGIPAGLVSWESGPAGRLRLPVSVHEHEVEAASSPIDVLTACPLETLPGRTPCLRALAHLRECATSWNMLIGVWGSAALELHTGYLYTHERSDLDFFLQPTPESTRQSLAACMADVRKVEEKFAVRIDAELALPNGYGVSLKEVMGETGNFVLGKGIKNVTLLQKEDILSILEHFPREMF